MIDEKNLNVFIRDYTDDIKKRHDFFGYFVAFATTTMTLLTASFNEKYGFSGAVWNALFIFIDLWIFCVMVKGAWNWYKTKDASPDNLILKIKNKGEISEKRKVETIQFNTK